MRRERGNWAGPRSLRRCQPDQVPRVCVSIAPRPGGYPWRLWVNYSRNCRWRTIDDRWSKVAGRGSRVDGQKSMVKGQWSRVRGRWSTAGSLEPGAQKCLRQFPQDKALQVVRLGDPEHDRMIAGLHALFDDAHFGTGVERRIEDRLGK